MPIWLSKATAAGDNHASLKMVYFKISVRYYHEDHARQCYTYQGGTEAHGERCVGDLFSNLIVSHPELQTCLLIGVGGR